MRDPGELRIVSLLPSATEMVFALGLGNQLKAVTHSCDFPPEARRLPQIVRTHLSTEARTPLDIDKAVRASLDAGSSLYTVDAALLRAIEPTHLLTQDLCDVCAPSGESLSSALADLPSPPRVLRMAPATLEEIHGTLLELARTTGTEEAAERRIAEDRRRIEAVRQAIPIGSKRPRVFCAEWTDPLYCAGHWIPEQVDLAGGRDVLGRPGRKSVRVSWEEVRNSDPEVIVLMPCGFNATDAASHLAGLQSLPGWDSVAAVRMGRIHAVDSAFFSRPGPRVIDGIELLAQLLHPAAAG